jgi:hypothetical protein
LYASGQAATPLQVPSSNITPSSTPRNEPQAATDLRFVGAAFGAAWTIRPDKEVRLRAVSMKPRKLAVKDCAPQQIAGLQPRYFCRLIATIQLA